MRGESRRLEEGDARCGEVVGKPDARASRPAQSRRVAARDVREQTFHR
jgi:hypothetical protein